MVCVATLFLTVTQEKLILGVNFPFPITIFKTEMDIFEIEQKFRHRLGVNEMLTLTHLTLNGDIDCKDIIGLCGHQNPQIAFRASWTLESIAYRNPEIFLFHLSDFLSLYPTITNHSVQRCFTKIMMQLTDEKFMRKAMFKASVFDECLTVSFDWLLNPETPVAVQCNALDIIFQLSPYHDWIIEELAIILEQKLVSNSPALLSRSKKILKRINLK